MKYLSDIISCSSIIVMIIIYYLTVKVMLKIYRDTSNDMKKAQEDEFEARRKERAIIKKEKLLHAFMSRLCIQVEGYNFFKQSYSINKEQIWDNLNTIFQDLNKDIESINYIKKSSFKGTLKEYLEQAVLINWKGLRTVEELKAIFDDVKEYYGLFELDYINQQ
jgi:hypothetical protein